MCKMKAPKMPPMPEIAPARAIAREPDGGRDSIRRNYRDRFRSGANTILTSGMGVLENAQTQLKTLLGG